MIHHPKSTPDSPLKLIIEALRPRRVHIQRETLAQCWFQDVYSPVPYRHCDDDSAKQLYAVIRSEIQLRHAIGFQVQIGTKHLFQYFIICLFLFKTIMHI